jgi:hypothetical protein
MCRTILNITPLILFAIWLFGALPLIYLYGGPDEMIKELPSWAIWAPILAAVAATGSATVAYLALRVNRQNQRETTAKTNFREFLKLCVEYPDLARGTPTEENGAKYEWFVAHFLWATEEILKYEPEPWRENLELYVEYHGKYFENDKDFRTKDFKTYTKELQDFLIKIIPSLKTCR